MKYWLIIANGVGEWDFFDHKLYANKELLEHFVKNLQETKGKEDGVWYTIEEFEVA